MIQSARIRLLNDLPAANPARYILYWMQQSQRAAFNPALELAVAEANDRELPLVVCFGLTAYPEANARHYDFMLRGLAETARVLEKRGAAFVIRRAAPADLALELSKDAALVVCDRGYLKPQRVWRDQLAKSVRVRLVQVEGDVVVPVETASPKHEYAARTIRTKLQKQWDDFIEDLPSPKLRRSARGLGLKSEVDLGDIGAVLRSLKIDDRVGPVKRFTAGHRAARRLLDAFVDDGLDRYARRRGEPEAAAASHMSPYLHFGQISPVEIALAVRAVRTGDPDNRATYLEELIVRRELAMNRVFYAPDHDVYEGLPEWARKTLAAHAGDRRPHLYTAERFEAGETHDPYWNAAMREMTATGYMHNHLRMYWGKKILQWSASPQEAFDTTLRLNNRYFLDGRDANSFTNVGWIFGLHDRPWGSQPVFGSVRSMGPNTLKKFDADAYVTAVDRLAADEI